MGKRICSIDGCDSSVLARGWCCKHYNRWQKHGDPTVLLIARHDGDVQERFWAKVDKTDSCWNWTATVTSKYYGSYRVDRRRTVPAHRFAYELAVGPIPDDMEIDHRCHNTRCVNPSHLRLATPSQNCENRRGARSDSASGVRGVGWSACHQRWIARVYHKGRYVYSRSFRNREDAERAVISARNRYHTFNDMDRNPQGS